MLLHSGCDFVDSRLFVPMVALMHSSTPILRMKAFYFLIVTVIG
jgi:hypothetical protein